MNCPHCGVHIDEHPASRCLDAWVAVDVMELAGVGLDSVGDFQYLHSPDRPHFVSEYSTDIAAAWEVEQKIEELKLRARYVQHLVAAMLGKEVDSDEDMWWLLAHASPLDRCRAAIKATKESG